MAISNLRRFRIPWSWSILGLLFAVSAALSEEEEAMKILRCRHDDQCPRLYYCHMSTHHCIHKSVFPLEAEEYLGSILVCIVSGLANAGGLGGGAVVSPILIIFFGYKASVSVIVAYVLVFGGAIGNFIMTGLVRAPETGRRIVNYELGILCLPLLLMGTLIGVQVNRLLPELMILVVLVCLLIFLLHKVTAKAFQTYEKETIQNEVQTKLLDDKTPPPVPCNSPIGKGRQLPSEMPKSVISITPIQMGSESNGDHHSVELDKILEEEKNVVPIRKLAPVLLLVLFIVSVNLLKGSPRFESILGISYCGGFYWILVLGTIAICFGVYMITSKSAVSIYETKERVKYPFEDEFRLDSYNIGKISMYATVAGVLAGIAGIGGGMVMSPLLLEMGLKPTAASTTSSLTVIFTSFISLSVAILGGLLEWDQVIWFFLLSSIGALTVSSVLNYLVKKYKRQSIILFTLLTVVAVSLLVIIFFTGSSVLEDPSEYLNFRTFC